MYRVTNIDGEVKEFETSQNFIAYVNIVKAENSDESFVTDTIDTAIEYIQEYCSNLYFEFL